MAENVIGIEGHFDWQLDRAIHGLAHPVMLFLLFVLFCPRGTNGPARAMGRVVFGGVCPSNGRSAGLVGDFHQ